MRASRKNQAKPVAVAFAFIRCTVYWRQPLAFLLQRLYQAVLVMLAVGLIAFALFNFVGDPINGMVGVDTSLADREKLRQELGLNDSFVVQFAGFIGNAVRGDFGLSYQEARPVGQIIFEKLPATLELSTVAAGLALLLGVPMGVFTALYRRSWLSQLLLAVSLAGVSLPTFLIGILLILVFAVVLGRPRKCRPFRLVELGPRDIGRLPSNHPARGYAGPVSDETLIMRLVRAEMIEVLRTDYIKFARARGLTNRAVNFGHALKNTLIPVITIAGLQLGSIIAFAIITETVFQWPGMGLMFIQAVGFVDIPVIAAYLVLVGFFFVVINFVVDLLYLVLDPRLRVDRERVGIG
jgi:peptide/nickel transport system permease protein